MNSTVDTPHRAEYQQVATWIWFAILAGPFAWAVDFGLSYGLTSRACTVGSPMLLLVSSAVTFTVATSGLLLAWRRYQGLTRATGDDLAFHGDSQWFLIMAALGASTGFMLAIIAAAIPRLVLHPCV